MPVFLFEVADRSPSKGRDANFAGSVQCMVLHDSAEEALASIKEFVHVSLSKETADPNKTAAMALVKGKPRLYR